MKSILTLLAVLLLAPLAARAGNPIVDGQGLTDPHATIYGDRVWVYATHDADAKGKNFVMKDWWVWSSADLVNWKHEGTLRPEQTFIGKPFDSCWATFGISRNGKYYWYFSAGPREIGVVVADAPAGPWKDPLGRPLIAKGLTPTEQRDPDLFTDDDGKAYMVYGTFDYFIVRLNNDMISLAEKPLPLQIEQKEGPYGKGKTDDKPSLHKRNGIYYLSWSGFYATSKTVYGPYVCKGPVIAPERVAPEFRNQNLFHDRHGNFFTWNNQWYYIFNDKSQPGRSDYFRDSCLAYVHYRDNGEIAPIRIDRIGVGQYDASTGRIEAEDYFSARGADVTESPGGFDVRNLRQGSILTYPNVMNLPRNPVASFRVACGNPNGATIEIHENNAEGVLLGSCTVPAAEGWNRYQTVSCPLQTAAGTKSLCLTFKGNGGELLRLDYFVAGHGPQEDLRAHSKLEGADASGGGQPLQPAYDATAVPALTMEKAPAVDFDEIVFVRRHTYNSNHYYTEYINSTWLPGGNLCVLNLKTGAVRELAPQLTGGVFERFDLSFDAKRVVFAWKKGPLEGYRIYEIGIDGAGLRQLTFPPANEAELVKKYQIDALYHHGTDDMQPCYLADGGIAFISTRCQYAILCNSSDNFTTTLLYRMNADGGGMQRLSHNSVSEACPVALPDGRLLYTRWEYVDKGAVSVKCLWAMNPDGSGSSEVYGNDISLPPTLIYGRPIPNSSARYVVLGTPHYPQNGMGTVIRLDMTRPIRTREPMTYMTADVDIQAEGGFAFRTPAGWLNDATGKGRLFKDPYPLSDDLFLVAQKPAGPRWSEANAYGLYWLDSQGRTRLVYQDPKISCWLPYPLKPRPVPPVKPSVVDAKLAKQGKAVCMVKDVYHGLAGVRPGEIKYIRILEQIPRPWAARRQWPGDLYDQQYACITKDTHLGLKVQHGVVPVEEDGSAYFEVPADANVFFQVLDDKFMAVQTERTFVNYRPGEARGCVGCHEVPSDTISAKPAAGVAQALRRAPSVPGPQPGEKSAGRTLDYAADVQPVWDLHCIACHGGKTPKAGLDLRGEKTELFNVSYEALVPERRKGFHDRGLLGPVIGENHPKTGNVEYLPARSLGSHASVLVAMLSDGHVTLASPEQEKRARQLAIVHRSLKLVPEELLRVTNWVDTNCQYYGSYWGRRNLRYADLPDFRPTSTFEQARDRDFDDK